MLNLDIINKEIEKLERCKYTNYEVCNKLATLYTVRHFYSNHKNNEIEEQYQKVKNEVITTNQI